MVLVCLFGQLLSFGYGLAVLRSGLGLAAFFETVADLSEFNLIFTYYERLCFLLRDVVMKAFWGFSFGVTPNFVIFSIFLGFNNSNACIWGC